jgi:hypothetical protein
MFPAPRTHAPDGVLHMRADGVNAQAEFLRDLFVRRSSPECSDDFALTLGQAVYAGQFTAALRSLCSKSFAVNNYALGLTAKADGCA